MFIECYDADVKYSSYINVDKISEVFVKDHTPEDNAKNAGFVIEAFIVVSPSNSRIVSDIYTTREEAEKALKDIVKKMNKNK